MLIRDAVFWVTDRAVSSAYRGIELDTHTTSWIESPDIFSLNFGGTPERLFQTLPSTEGKFFCFCGSSNFHHLDLVNLKRLKVGFGLPIQLILVDQHMDCVRYDEKNKWLHCGNWVSYAYQKGLISKVVMIGCRDYRKLPTFDLSLEKDGNLFYIPLPSKSELNGLLDPSQPTYLSVDTDVLSIPSDWGQGLHSLNAVLDAPFWDFLHHANWVGAFLHGHVTDNRRFLDMFLAMISSPAVSAADNPLLNFKQNIVHGVWPKLRASLFLPRLSLDEQVKVMLALYDKAVKVRKTETPLRLSLN